MVWSYTKKTNNALIRKSDAIHVEVNDRGRGRPKLIWVEIIKKDLIWYGLTDIIALERVDWQNMIHVANPK